MSLAANRKHFSSVCVSIQGRWDALPEPSAALKKLKYPRKQKILLPAQSQAACTGVIVHNCAFQFCIFSGLETNQKFSKDTRLSILWHWPCNKVFKAVTLLQSQWAQVCGPVLKNRDKLTFHRLRLPLHKVISVLESQNNSGWKISQEIKEVLLPLKQSPVGWSRLDAKCPLGLYFSPQLDGERENTIKVGWGKDRETSLSKSTPWVRLVYLGKILLLPKSEQDNK